MSLPNIQNCPTCGKVFVKGAAEVCPACMKEIEKQYDLCMKFLRENKRCTIQEMSDETGVSVKQISKFIREGKISIAHAPNMGYPCDMCGTIIRESHICDSCRSKLSKDVKNLHEDTVRRDELQKQDGKISYNISDRLKERR